MTKESDRFPRRGHPGRMRFQGPGGNRTHRLPAAEIAAVVSHRACVEASAHKDPVEPSLQHCRVTVPPDRELEYHHVRTFQPSNFPLDIFRQRVGPESMSLLTQGREDAAIFAIPVVIRTFARIEIFTIQIGNLDGIPLLSQGSPGHLRQCRVERNRLRDGNGRSVRAWVPSVLNDEEFETFRSVEQFGPVHVHASGRGWRSAHSALEHGEVARCSGGRPPVPALHGGARPRASNRVGGFDAWRGASFREGLGRRGDTRAVKAAPRLGSRPGRRTCVR